MKKINLSIAILVLSNSAWAGSASQINSISIRLNSSLHGGISRAAAFRPVILPAPQETRKYDFGTFEGYRSRRVSPVVQAIREAETASAADGLLAGLSIGVAATITGTLFAKKFLYRRMTKAVNFGLMSGVILGALGGTIIAISSYKDTYKTSMYESRFNQPEETFQGRFKEFHP